MRLYETSKIYLGHECPAFGLRNVFKRRNKLTTELLSYLDVRLTADLLDEVINVISEYLPKVQPTVLENCLRVFIDQILTRDKIIEIAWRFAGNLKTLQTGKSVFPWMNQKYIEWVPVSVVKTAKNKDKITVTLRILSGTPCPMLIFFNWKEGNIRYISRLVGFTSERQSRPLSHYSNIVGMVFCGCLIPALSANQPTFPTESIYCSSSMLDNNKKLIDSRNRQLTPCIRNYSWDCYRCHVGLDQCNRAIRQTTGRCS